MNRIGFIIGGVAFLVAAIVSIINLRIYRYTKIKSYFLMGLGGGIMNIGLILSLVSLKLGMSIMFLGYIITLTGQEIETSKLEIKAKEMMNKISWWKCLTGKVSGVDRNIFAELSISNRMVIFILSWTIPFGIVIGFFLYYMYHISEKYGLNPYLCSVIILSPIILLILPITIYLIISLIARNIKSSEVVI